ncbi:hypothetical protein [Mycolicibacterium helvum]|nr:hypothetical protein [Mycolicibacterium helvum]
MLSQYLHDPSNGLWLVDHIKIGFLDPLYVILLSKACRYQRDPQSAPALT